MIAALKQFDDPRVINFRPAPPDGPSYMTIMREFGSWSKARKAAGFKVRRIGRPKGARDLRKRVRRKKEQAYFRKAS